MVVGYDENRPDFSPAADFKARLFLLPENPVFVPQWNYSGVGILPKKNYFVLFVQNAICLVGVWGLTLRTDILPARGYLIDLEGYGFAIAVDKTE